MEASATARSEAERQVTAAAERYREAVASSEAGGRPQTGQQQAVKSVNRAGELLEFVLRRAAASGVEPARLAELTGWEPDRVDEALGLTRDGPLPARPPGSVEASLRLHSLMGEVLADVDDETWAPEGADIDVLHDALRQTWQDWRAGRR